MIYSHSYAKNMPEKYPTYPIRLCFHNRRLNFVESNGRFLPVSNDEVYESYVAWLAKKILE